MIESSIWSLIAVLRILSHGAGPNISTFIVYATINKSHIEKSPPHGFESTLGEFESLNWELVAWEGQECGRIVQCHGRSCRGTLFSSSEDSLIAQIETTEKYLQDICPMKLNMYLNVCCEGSRPTHQSQVKGTTTSEMRNGRKRRRDSMGLAKFEAEMIRDLDNEPTDLNRSVPPGPRYHLRSKARKVASN